MTEKWTEHFNNIYTNGGGFYGVIEEIEDKLHLGRVTRREKTFPLLRLCGEGE